MKKISFKRAYLIYLAVLAALVIGSVSYVYSCCASTRPSQPERQVWLAVEELAAKAAGGAFLEEYDLPRPTPAPMSRARTSGRRIWPCSGTRRT